MNIDENEGPKIRNRSSKRKYGIKGFWAVTVHANWRVIFRFDQAAEYVDYVDYH
jgi:toxin HigB-1